MLMQKRLNKIIVFIIILSVPLISLCQEDQLRTEIEKIIWHDTSIDFEETPGFITAIILPDTHFILSFGSMSKLDTNPLEPTDLFEIGGLAKVFTTELVWKLEQSGMLLSAAKVNSLLPIPFGNPALNDLSLIDLINHRSSLPKIPQGLGSVEQDADQPYEHFTKTQVLQYYQNYVPRKRKKEGFIYSHYNYALMECALEYHSKKDLESLLKSYLFYPLDLNSIQISSDKLSNASLTPGYNLAMKKSIPLKFSSFQAAVGMRSTLEDLMKFCQYKIGQSYPDKYKRKIGFFQGAGISRKLYFENGWYIIKSKKGKFIYSHSGRTNGHSAYMHFIPETKTGVVLLANSAKGTEDLSLLILRLINNYKI